MKIEHPEIPDQVAVCTDKAFTRIWEPKGWKEAPADAEVTPVSQADQGDPYDPSAFTVKEVNDHLATLPEGDPERQRILDVEQSGQNRTGITG